MITCCEVERTGQKSIVAYFGVVMSWSFRGRRAEKCKYYTLVPRFNPATPEYICDKLLTPCLVVKWRLE